MRRAKQWSIILSAVLLSAGCAPHKSAKSAQASAKASEVASTEPEVATTAPATTEATTEAATEPASQPAITPTTEATTAPVTQPSAAATTEAASLPAAAATEAATQPAAAPATEAATLPSTAPATDAATLPATAPTTEASTQPGIEATTQPTTEAPTQPATQPVEATNAALAERLASIATVLLRTQNLNTPIWQYSEALLQAACKLAPNEPRFASYLMEAASHAGDSDVAIKALANYRKLRPDDQFAMVKQIDANLTSMDLDKKLKYINQIIDTTSVPAPVRSYAAELGAELNAERLDGLAAADLLDQAIQLDPLNLRALRVKFTAHPPQDSVERLKALLQLLRANPAQPAIGIGVARELAAAGLSAKSMDWYTLSLDMHQRMGIAPSSDVGVDYASEFLINGDPRGASVVCDRMSAQTPDDLNVWMLKLITCHALGDKDAFAKAKASALVAASNQLANLQRAAGDATATTRPIDTAEKVNLPDPSAVLAKLSATGHSELVAAYVPVATSIAWIKLYFSEDGAAAAGQANTWIKSVDAASTTNARLVDRLTGWAMLVAGNKEDARQKLQPLADTDPLAAVALVRMADNTPKAQQQADALARKALAANPSGLTGALLVDAFAPRGIKVVPGPDSAMVDRALADFPKDWMHLLDQPDRFYQLHLDPVRTGVAVPVGDPLLVRVSVTNVSDYDLTVGPEGVIHQDLWLDAQLRGILPPNVNPTMPGEAYERLAGPMILHPGDVAWQVVRLDQHGLFLLIDANPVRAFQITAMVSTNTISVGGQVTIGACGTRAQMSRLMERSAFPLQGSQMAADQRHHAIRHPRRENPHRRNRRQVRPRLGPAAGRQYT